MQSLFVAYLRASSAPVVAALVVGLVSAWALSYVAGGSQTPLPHLFYLPIILAAVRSSWLGGIGTAIAAGLLAGPALPADVAQGTGQSVEGWTLRLAIFVAVGGLVVYLTKGHSETLGSRFSDSIASSRLLRAIQRGEIEVFYQPIRATDDDRIVGLEALARWTGCAHGMVYPDEFIPQAERTGAVTALDRFVLREASRQVNAWSAEFALVDLSVNVSAASFAEHDLVAEVAAVLADTGLPPERLQLEITESAIIDDVPATRNQMTQLRKLGVRVAIDDFGTGQSSLSYLANFPVDTIKIDRTIVAPLITDPSSERLAEGIIRMLQALDLTVVAEGVETANQHNRLQSMGCHLVQGYHLGRPAPGIEIDRLLRTEFSTPAPDCLAGRYAVPGAVE